MAFDAATLSHLEEALSEAFKYHASLDTFLRRCGVTEPLLMKVRERADERTVHSRFDKAPKRFVAQELLHALDGLSADGDRIVAAMITNLLQLSFPEATGSAKAAIEALRSKAASDRKHAHEKRAEQQQQAERRQRAAEQVLEQKRADRQKQRDLLRDRFLGLMEEANAQTRGYLFETFLADLFEQEGLDPRRSFKLQGEQIDGSFMWRSRANLLEAKWTKAPAAGAEFAAFIYKIDGKTADTRGLYVSINGYSPDAIKGMNGKGALKFVCIDGTHLMRALSSNDGLQPILERVWRHADETGESYLPAASF